MRRIKVILIKEWRESLRNKMILFGAIFLPLFMVGAAEVMVYQGRGLDVPGAQIALFNTALMYFLILPAVIPLAIAAYSIIGEKEQGSLEPLLATPISDLELFLGKALASVIPGLVSSRASDARAAYQVSSLAILPGIVPLIIYSSKKTLVSLFLVGVEGVVLIAASTIVLYFAIKVFRREQILTRWK
jgi:ABC-2 type transport system permease protein